MKVGGGEEGGREEEGEEEEEGTRREEGGGDDADPGAADGAEREARAAAGPEGGLQGVRGEAIVLEDADRGDGAAAVADRGAGAGAAADPLLPVRAGLEGLHIDGTVGKRGT